MDKKQIQSVIDSQRAAVEASNAEFKKCTDAFCRLFEQFGVDTIYLKNEYVTEDPWGIETYYCEILLNKGIEDRTVISVKDTDGLTVDLELADFPPCYNLLVETINYNLANCIPTSEWDKSEKSDFEKIEYNLPPISENLGLSEDAARKISESLETADLATKASMKSLLNEYDIPVILIKTPESTGVECKKRGKSKTVNYVRLHSGGTLDPYPEYSSDGEFFWPSGNYDDPFPYADVLSKMYQAIEYYLTHGIPTSDWGGQNDITRALSKMKVNPSIIEVLNSDQEGEVLGRKVRITTVSELRPVGLHLTSFILFEDMNGWLETRSIRFVPDSDDIIVNYVVRYHIHSDVCCDSIKDVATLIQHYGITAESPATMLKDLQTALKADAEAKNIKSVLDFCSLFKDLDIKYSFGPETADWECDDEREESDWDDSDDDDFSSNDEEDWDDESEDVDNDD